MAFRRLAQEHEKLKRRIHAFRVPLSPRGQRVAMVAYVSLGFAGGLGLMGWAIGQSGKKWEAVQNEDGTVTYKVPDAVRARNALNARHLKNSRESALQAHSNLEEHPGRVNESPSLK
mmetsp:Transcript_11415/g.20177  ORF Transcript_11415/g.20177 Transcript_11415/m.20177 type:complete len:117 (+) Transcript_11415:205-555(+)|eukprot:CAMPEP_0184525608 /NCGR_PEP_ID=MMETSP0198_2-20121128/10199_1 /TAXON_ID=1112570 /ORGANISM="Thraustochytrium sp., Strain LLF1b" /LENGTH=116 /DNA_ID=CAMNT_0026917099 /DNA_START=157 /DNA_END=507 /DNA_ORIENTATION=-